jgi:hypothetical protein
VKKTVMLVAGGLEIGSGDSDVTQPASKFAQKVPQSIEVKQLRACQGWQSNGGALNLFG